MGVSFGAFTFDPECRQLRSGARPLDLSPKALELLQILLASRPRAISKTELHQRLWPTTFVAESTLTSLVAELRRVLEDPARSPAFVRTVHRFGYAFCGAATDAPPAHPAPGPTHWIVWEHGHARLQDGDNVLGRARDASVWLDSISVSRRHARIVVSGSEVTLEDLGSKNGTTLSGSPVRSPCRLADGDEFALGSVRVTFRISTPDAVTATDVKRFSRGAG